MFLIILWPSPVVTKLAPPVVTKFAPPVVTKSIPPVVTKLEPGSTRTQWMQVPIRTFPIGGPWGIRVTGQPSSWRDVATSRQHRRCLFWRGRLGGCSIWAKLENTGVFENTDLGNPWKIQCWKNSRTNSCIIGLASCHAIMSLLWSKGPSLLQSATSWNFVTPPRWSPVFKCTLPYIYIYIYHI